MRNIYVYIPGFEYDSKGPLHIDAIELKAYVASENSEEGQPLKTYIYIGNKFPSIEGSVIYRCVYSDSDYTDTEGNNFNWIKDRYDDSDKVKEPFASSYACIHRNSADAPIIINRAMTGSYYDFVTISGEITHHIIGMYDNVNHCKEITNLNSEQHDGLFAIQVENLNTDIVLKFNLYSRVNTSEDGISSEVGIKEDISTVRENINNKNNVIDTTQYIKVGEFTKTYNPAISGNKIDLKNVTFQGVENEPSQQYFDWDLGNEKSWDIPVNAELLVTDTHLPKKENHYIQLKYDKELKKFIDPENLPCNNFNETDFYLNFYKDNLRSFLLSFNKEDLISKGVSSLAWRTSNIDFNSCVYNRWQNAVAFNATYNKDLKIGYEYKLCKADLSNLSYLYNTPATILIANANAETSSKQVIFSIDSWGRSFPGGSRDDLLSMKSYSVTDPYHYLEKIKDYGHWLNYYPANDSSDKLNIDTASVHINYELLTSKQQLKIALSSEKLFFNYTLNITESLNTLDNQLYDYYTNRSEFNDQDYILSIDLGWTIDLDKLSRIKSLYISNLFSNENNSEVHFVQQSLLGSNLTKVLLQDTNKIGLYFTLSNLSFPIIAYDVKEFGDPNGNWLRSHKSNSRILLEWSTFKKNIQDRGIGTVSIFIPQTFYIDSKNSKIDFYNKGDYKIVPVVLVISDQIQVGYIKNGWQQVNVEETNLLASEENGFEISNVIKDSSRLKTPLDLVYRTGHKYYSSFCNEKRFISLINSVNKPIIIDKYIIVAPINNDFDLQTSLYVLRILTGKNNNKNILILYRIEDSNNQELESNTITLENNLVAFCLKPGEKLIINSIKSTTTLDFDYIGGIGLYKVNLEQKDTNTLALKLAVKKITTSCLVPFGNTAVYESIIFPSVFCAKENIEFCKRRYDSPYRNAQVNSGKDYNPDYDNDYCSSLNDDPIYHYYNFKYLPQEAIYDVEGFYQIPDGDNSTIDLDKVELFGDLKQELITALGTINVKTS